MTETARRLAEDQKAAQAEGGGVVEIGAGQELKSVAQDNEDEFRSAGQEIIDRGKKIVEQYPETGKVIGLIKVDVKGVFEKSSGEARRVLASAAGQNREPEPAAHVLEDEAAARSDLGRNIPGEMKEPNKGEPVLKPTPEQTAPVMIGGKMIELPQAVRIDASRIIDSEADSVRQLLERFTALYDSDILNGTEYAKELAQAINIKYEGLIQAI